MKKFIVTIVLLFAMVSSVVANENIRNENLFSTFYSYVDDLNESYKREAEISKRMEKIYYYNLLDKKANLTLKGESTEVIDQKISEAEAKIEAIAAPVQIKIKSIEYSSDVDWNAPDGTYAKKLNNTYEFELVVSKENLGPALVALCAGLRGFFDDTNYSDEEEIPGVSNEDLRDCYNLVDIAANYFLDLLSNEECALIRQYCIDTVGLEVYQMILEDLE